MKYIICTFLSLFIVTATHAQDIRTYCNTVGEAGRTLLQVLLDSDSPISMEEGRKLIIKNLIIKGANKEQVVLVNNRIIHAQDLISRNIKVIRSMRNSSDMGRIISKYCIAEGRMQ